MIWRRKWREKQRRLRGTLHKTHIHSVFGNKLFHRVLWRTDKRSLAGGLSLGLFIAFTPTIPFQMLLAAAGAIYLKVNLPLALAACWVTNPVTAIPVYLFAWKLGRNLTENIVFIERAVEFFSIHERSANFFRHSFYLWAGCLLLSIIAAVLAQVLVRLFWNVGRKVIHRHQPKSPHDDNEPMPDICDQ